MPAPTAPHAATVPETPSRTTPRRRRESAARTAPHRKVSGRTAASRRAPGLAAGAVFVAAITLAGCTGGPDPIAQSPTPSATGSTALQASDAWGQLAGRVAAAQDRRYTASYAQTVKGRAGATLTVTIAADRSWQVIVPGGALGGTATVALTHTAAGTYQCPLLPTPTCVLAGATVPARSDPHFQHIFTDWLDILVDRQSAISVAAADPIPGAAGQCFSVEPNAAGIAAPMDAGIFCFDTDGTLTAATIAAGTLLLSGTPAAAPATVALPGPVVPGTPLGTASPPPPPPSPTASTTASPARTP